jgi:shikimate kinase
MGAGKTSVGRALARQLDWQFEDLDDRIERREKRKINEIFKFSGESGFREAETSALRELLGESADTSGKIVALGGGALAQKANLELLTDSGIPTVFLDGDAVELWQRCCLQAQAAGTERPLLSTFRDFRSKYKARMRHYIKATLRHSTSGKTVNQVAGELITVLGLKKQRRRRGEAN